MNMLICPTYIMLFVKRSSKSSIHNLENLEAIKRVYVSQLLCCTHFLTCIREALVTYIAS